MSDYDAFLASKNIAATPNGIRPVLPLPSKLFDWQARIVDWSLGQGVSALFEECGLGKSPQQLSWAQQVAEYTKERVLIVAPLAVANQTVREGQKFDIPVQYCRSQSDMREQIIITNYDMLDQFDPRLFSGVVLDESSILKSLMGKTKKKLIEMFASTKYKLACTATPSPNDHTELGNHSEFLGIMPSKEMLARWFINDGYKAGSYRLMQHGAPKFWRWVASWAACVSRPSDLGYSDDGFVLPSLDVQEHFVATDPERAFAQGRLFLDGTVSATGMWREKASTVKERAEWVADIVSQSPDESWVIWVETNPESDEVMRLLSASDVVEVRGSDKLAEKERKLLAFTNGEARVIITKLDIAGFGMNWQHSARMVFASPTYSFERTYQGLRRQWRYGQTRSVVAHMIYTEGESGIMTILKEKQMRHQEMQEAMNEAMQESGLVSNNRYVLQPSGNNVATGENWTLYHGDCIPTIQSKIEDDSVGFSIFSPPFASIFVYSDAEADMGNCSDYDEFSAHYGYLARELFRVTMPGRLCAIHCSDLPRHLYKEGVIGIYDFPSDLRIAMEGAGWVFHSRITIWKDPVTEMQRTKALGLLHKTFTERSEAARAGMADYLMVFRKWTPDMPDRQIKHDVKPGDYIGTNPPKKWTDQREHSIEVWQRYASPVWFDIDQTKVLNARVAREDKDERHLCPLQLDVIERAVWLWSNPGDLVLSPFAGIGSEGYQSLMMGRQFVGVELKESYWETAIKNLNEANRLLNVPTLFDLSEYVS